MAVDAVQKEVSLESEEGAKYALLTLLTQGLPFVLLTAEYDKDENSVSVQVETDVTDLAVLEYVLRSALESLPKEEEFRHEVVE